MNDFYGILNLFLLIWLMNDVLEMKRKLEKIAENKQMENE